MLSLESLETIINMKIYLHTHLSQPVMTFSTTPSADTKAFLFVHTGTDTQNMATNNQENWIIFLIMEFELIITSNNVEPPQHPAEHPIFLPLSPLCHLLLPIYRRAVRLACSEDISEWRMARVNDNRALYPYSAKSNTERWHKQFIVWRRRT